jgi:hypothetical protein
MHEAREVVPTLVNSVALGVNAGEVAVCAVGSRLENEVFDEARAVRVDNASFRAQRQRGGKRYQLARCVGLLCVNQLLKWSDGGSDHLTVATE